MVDNKGLKAVILAAGKGTRMRSLVPKVLHKIFGKTLMERVINTVSGISNLNEAFIIVGYQSDKVTEFIDNIYKNSSILISPVLQEPQLGTGDAVFKVHNQLKSYKGTLLILCADTPLLTRETLVEFINFHKESNASLTVLSALMDDPQNYGRIIRGIEGEVKGIVEEKDASEEEKVVQEVNAGVYCLEWEKISPSFFDLTSNNRQGEYYLTDIVEWAVKKDLKVEAFTLEEEDEIFGINSRADLATASYILNMKKVEALMEDGITVIDPENTWISPETSIGQDTVIYPGCFIEGENSLGKNNILGPNLYIGGNVRTGNYVNIFQSRVSDAIILDNSSVGPFAHLRDNVKIDNNVRIGNFVEIKHSEIHQSTNVSHLSYIGDSTLGQNVNIGAGTITANYNPLTKKKARTEIENGVKIGSNSVLVAPVKISENANIAAGSVITKDVPENSLAIARGQQKVLENWVIKKLKEQSTQ